MRIISKFKINVYPTWKQRFYEHARSEHARQWEPFHVRACVSFGCREPGITETIITCKTGIRYTGIGHNGIRYIKTGIRYNAIRDNGIRYNGEQESVITLKWAIWNQV